MLIERETEFKQLHNALQSAIAGHFSVALLIGDSGTGKSYLADAFLRHAEKNDSELIAVCAIGDQLFGRTSSLRAVRSVFAFLCGISESHKGAVACTSDIHRLAECRRSFLSSLAMAPSAAVNFLLRPKLEHFRSARVDDKVIKNWLSRSDSQPNLIENLQEIQSGIAQLLDQLRNPIVIVLDDIQWIDPASLKIFLGLESELQNANVLLVMIARTDSDPFEKFEGDLVLNQLTNAVSKKTENVIINLNKTRVLRGQKFCAELLESRGLDASDASARQLFDISGANPLFACDLLDLVGNGNGNGNGNGSTGLENSLVGVKIQWEMLPTKHSEALERRLQQLDVNVARVIETAAVEGTEFTAEVISKVLGVEIFQVLEILETELGRKHALVEDIAAVAQLAKPGTLNKMSRFRFSHGYYRNLIYSNRIWSSRRKELHRRIGNALEDLLQLDLEGAAAQLARHFDLAGAFPQAFKYYKLAAERALIFADFDAAKFCSDLGVDLSRRCQEPLEHDRSAIYVSAVIAARTRGEFLRAEELSREALSLLTPSALVEHRVSFKSELARSLYNQDRGYGEADTVLSEAITLSANSNLDVYLADLFRQRGILHQRQGRYSAAIDDYLESLRLAHERGALAIVTDTINSIGVALGLSGAFVLSAKCHWTALALAADRSNTSRDTLFLNDLAGSLRRLGRYAEVSEVILRSKILAKAQGKIGAMARAYYEAAQLERVLGNWAAYRIALNQTIELASSPGLHSPHLYKAQGELTQLNLLMREPIAKEEEFSFAPRVSGTTELFSADYLAGLIDLHMNKSHSQALVHFENVITEINGMSSQSCWAWPFLKFFASVGIACCKGDEYILQNNTITDQFVQISAKLRTEPMLKELEFSLQVLEMVSGKSQLPSLSVDVGANDILIDTIGNLEARVLKALAALGVELV